MSVKNLLDPILEQGIRNTHFFEGRLLAGRDLREQQEANRQHDRNLGQAIGQGIISGLEVVLDDGHDGSDGEPPVVTIKKGLAINGQGEIIGLPYDDIKLALSRSIETPVIELADFYACAGPPNHQHIPNGVGVYILAMSPVAGYREQAPKSGLGDEGIVKGCGSRYIQEGVEFRLVEITKNTLLSMPGLSVEVSDLLEDDLLNQASPVGKNDLQELSMLRNILGYLSLGLNRVVEYQADDMAQRAASASVDYTDVLEKLSSLGELTSCDIPLCMIYWTLEGIAFVDNWSVRRMIVDRSLQSYGIHYSRTGMERLLQFLDQIDDLKEQLPSLNLFEMKDYFRYIPYAGIVPVKLKSTDVGGFSPTNLFSGYTDKTVNILDKAKASLIINEAFFNDPIDLSKDGLVIQLYSLRHLASSSNNYSTSYYVYANRNHRGPVLLDGLARSMLDAWDVYKALLTRQVFLPVPDTPVKAMSHVIITTAIRNVLDIANRFAAVGLSGQLNVPGGLEAYSSMHKVQNDMAVLFQSDIPGIDDTQERELFGSRIDTLLNDSLPDGGRALLPAIDANDFLGAIAAQNEINKFVGSWTGEGVAIGPFGFEYRRSPGGAGLVPGGPATLHWFNLFNRTNRTVTMSLHGTVEDVAGTWSGDVVIRREAGGDEMTSVILASGAEREVAVMIRVPADALVDDVVQLTLVAEIGPPTNRTSSSPITGRPFYVDAETGDPVVGQVTIEGHGVQPGVNLANLPPETTFIIAFGVSYQSSEGATDFNFDITVAATNPGEWHIREQSSAQPLQDIGGGVYRYVIDALSPDEGRRDINFEFTTPPASGLGAKTAVLSFLISSISLDSPISHDYDGTTLTLVVP